MLIFLGATAMVVMAEMGDKTQLLAMAFATRFPARAVLWGVFLATILNHALAVALGTYLGSSINLEMVQMVAAASFILFGLWTIRGDSLDGEDKRKTFLGPIMTVALAFFFVEMGDKTQLATIALAAKYNTSGNHNRNAYSRCPGNLRRGCGWKKNSGKIYKMDVCPYIYCLRLHWFV